MSDAEAREARKAAIADDRERVQRAHRPALRRRDALPGRRVPALPLQEVHGRAAGVRPGAVDRLLRRRPRQLHLPAPRPRHLPLARLRERPAGEAAVVPALERRRASRDGDLVFVSGQPRLDLAARDDGRSLEYLRDQALPFRLEMLKRRLAALRAYSARGAEQKRRALERRSSASRTRQKALGGRLRGAPRREGDGGEGRRGEGPAREGGGRRRARAVDRATPGPRSRRIQRSSPRGRWTRGSSSFGGSRLLGDRRPDRAATSPR